ncbi:retrovirus polyprotein, putative [Talaromyces stipitatus ATCC 10500]|uniref:Retrovirus polyprotein, putative n=1 Tax=Talaromyces stipitatus (strain ATCC 10500 / CBS 375.48 / QM 6759 / NRRL 1006) TaxID=441959 RepID=B8MTS1_TALSN|nr:retrovirus polyprotein, putative [Talaromyces stipitatus ATCC 10500]EED12556.1 retrovirus polyprotein, putative [Talaromyces stipitatus ATCC 10500]
MLYCFSTVTELEHEVHVKKVLERLRKAGLQAAIHNRIAALLYRLTRLDVPFVWGAACQEAFDRLKVYLVSAPVLAHYRPELPTRVETDASDGVVEVVLSQLQDDGEWHPVAYYSHTMIPAEQNYDIHDKEMLANVKALEEWRPKLVGLQHTLTRREGADRENNLEHRHQTLLPREVLDSEIVQELGIPGIAAMDASVDIISRVILTNRDAAASDVYQTLVEKHKDWSISDGRLLYQDRLYVPDSGDLRARLLDEVHRQPSIAHPGKNKMKELVKERFYWETWSTNVDRYVDNCMTCKRTNTRRDFPPGLLQPLPVPTRPWQHVSMDFMTYPADKTISGVNTVPQDCHRTGLGQLWVKHLYRRTGAPDTIVSDRGLQFISEFWGEVCKILGIKIVLSTANHAQTDGQTEIANQYLSQRLHPYAEGPFTIIEKVGNSFKLDLPEGLNVHPIFSPDKLRLASRSEPFPGQVIDPSPPVLVNGEQEWEVQEILDSRLVGGSCITAYSG